MPSPFPGMDPWLEDPDLWPGLHNRLIADIQAELNRLVRPKYIAMTEWRVYLTDEPDDRAGRRQRVPDLSVQWSGAGSPPAAVQYQAVSPGGLVARVVPRRRARQFRVVLREYSSRAVVTVIELLSPVNKHPGSHGRGSFLRKRRQVLGSDANWVEIDLLRAGADTFSRHRLPPCEYAVHTSPVELRPDSRVWPIRLPDRLPAVTVPLRSPDPGVSLDLQAVFDQSVHLGGYDAVADYRRPPVPPLPPDLDAWADGLLREKGLR